MSEKFWMIEEEDLIRTLPVRWQVWIIENEINEIKLSNKDRKPPPEPVKCLTPLLWHLEHIQELEDFLAEIRSPGYRRQEAAPPKPSTPAPARSWLCKLLCRSRLKRT